MGYEMSVELIKINVQIIIHSKVDSGCPRWGAYDENMREVKKKSNIQGLQEEGRKSN